MICYLTPMSNYACIGRCVLKNTYLRYRELEKIRSEVNTNYEKYDGKRLCVHPSYGLDGESYFYYFENRGFDDYTFYARVENDL